MSQTTVTAIVQNGALVTSEPLGVPDGTKVTINIHVEAEAVSADQNQKEIFEILSRRHASGHTDTAARHNEHQP